MEQNGRAPYLSHISPEYLENLKEVYDTDPAQLPLTWQTFFDGMSVANTWESPMAPPAATTSKEAPPKIQAQPQQIDLELRLLDLIEAYRQRGHLYAKLNPLNGDGTQDFSALAPGHFGLDSVPTSTKFKGARVLGLKGDPEGAGLEQVVTCLQDTYCSYVGVEYMHISDEVTRVWLEQRMEPHRNRTQFSVEEKKVFLEDLIQGTFFENFLQTNFTGQKRFSLEGAESTIPALKQMIRTLAGDGVREIMIGMAHRGRLNVLVNVLKKSYEQVFSEFSDAPYEDQHNFSGDVKYHMGYSSTVDVDGKAVHLALAFNPSHLEAVDPVVQGIARAKQELRYKNDFNALVPVLIHGDAAVIGQGVVTETMNFSNLNGYSTGGTIHLVINNQIGFTTLPKESRSTHYCTDFAKSIQAPVFHVNGDHVESVVHAVSLAAEFRMKFNRDVFVDIICYRKYGHNEGDEPRFTQPAMYSKISKTKKTLDKYIEQLIKDGTIDASFPTKLAQSFNQLLDETLTRVKAAPKTLSLETLKSDWSDLRAGTYEDLIAKCETAVDMKSIQEILDLIHKIPSNIKPLSKFRKMLESRYQKIQETQTVDWAMGEQLAYGSLLKEGLSVRLSGQDAIRGTFSHRHLAMVNDETSERYMPLKALESGKTRFAAYNSPLSEFAVMGFDFGYSSAAPYTLTMWEAQFGDFANGAQVIIDQFLSGSEGKWQRMNGLVLLLPHGYEGQGPEHSSARLERYLQLTAEANMQVVYPTTPAQMFHVLRRQMKRSFRKPLVIMTPKSPLRMPEVTSSLTEFTEGQFENLLITGASSDKCKRVLFCSGKVYWDLQKRAVELGETGTTTIVRVEQLYPLDFPHLEDFLKQYKGVKKWLWVQEEPENMGAWYHFRMATLHLNLPLKYVGRKASASVATGSPSKHNRQQQELLANAFAD
jgi:2-oxoglutarate dehydrogenase E1 component